MKITVTQEDIDNGVRDSCRYCPVAIAVLRATGRPRGSVRVDGTAIDMGDKVIGLTREVEAWITRYDYTRQGAPFEFEVDI